MMVRHMSQENDFYTIREMEEKTGRDRKLLYKACANGELPSVRLGKRILIPKSAYQRYLDGEWTPQTAKETA